MLTTHNIAQLNRALENSFAAIKRDMNDLKLTVNAHNEQYSNVRKDLESLKSDVATKDKINVLKIKIGELNEAVNKVWDLEKQIKSGIGGKQVHDAIGELNAKLIALNVKVTETSKVSVTEPQMKALVSQINSELGRMHQELRNAELRRDQLRRQDISEHTQKLGQRIDSTNKDIDGLRKDLKSYVNRDEVKRIVEDINKDFANVKKEISTIYKRDSAFVRESEVKDIVAKINKEFDGVAKELESIKNKGKEYVTANQVRGLIDDISAEFDDVRSDLKKIAGVKDDKTKKEVDELKKSVKKIGRELGSVAEYDSAVPAKKVSHKKKFVFANLLIFVSFVLLIGSIYSYFTGYLSSMDNLAISAVVLFVIGMLFRIYAVVKSSKV